ncbi:MAG: hypothetical protein ACREAU_06755 [Nitrosopumilaceae archaeon]
MPTKLTQAQFITRSGCTHNHKYDYTLSVYTRGNIKVKIICPSHGVFEQTPEGHLRGQGCPSCAKNKKVDLVAFLQKSNQIHQFKYDYRLVAYTDSHHKVKIICPQHGLFLQKPFLHMIGRGCWLCKSDSCRMLNIKKATLTFEQKSNIQHNHIYSYNLVEYVDAFIKVKIICPIHGVFQQKPNDHLNGHGCSFCGQESRTRKTIERGGGYSYEYFIKHPEKKDKKATLYIAKMLDIFHNQHFIKIGITTCKFEERYPPRKYFELNILPIFISKEIPLYQAFLIEKHMQAIFNHKRFFPQVRFAGYTECFHHECLPNILSFVKSVWN